MVDCRVVWDREGRISEIHVVASGERPAKMIARDIQTLLLVHHNLAVPYQKVSIVSPSRPVPRTSTPPARPSPAAGEPVQREAPLREGAPAAGVPAPAGAAEEEGELGFPPLPPPVGSPGWSLESVQLRLDVGRAEVTATLVHEDGRRLQGVSAGLATQYGMALAGARAVVEALAAGSETHGWTTLDWVDLAGPVSSRVVVASVSRSVPGPPWRARSGVGAAPLRGDAAAAGALAALEALGKVSSR